MADRSPVSQRGRMIGPQLQGAVIVGKGLVVETLPLEGYAAIIERQVILGIEVDRARKEFNRPVELLFLQRLHPMVVQVYRVLLGEAAVGSDKG